MDNSKLTSMLYHDPLQPISMGCMRCPEVSVCGGLQVSRGVFNCMDFCRCDDVTTCSYVCPKNPERFVSRVWEIGGFGFENVPKSRGLPHPKLPLVVPILFHGYHRESRLQSRAIAVKLHQLMHYSSGKLKFASKAEMAWHFKFDVDAQVVITGVDKDRIIEPYWSRAHKSGIVNQLRHLSPDLITVPNFSMFLHAPRWDNMHNMKRIAICWSELASCGIPASLHLNARTDRDWERWTDFIGERDEVTSITVEFATGLARKERGRLYVDRLLMLAAKLPRPLHLVMRGGARHLRVLSKSFSNISLLDSSAFMKTVHRRRLDWKRGQLVRWRALAMEETEPLDALLQANVDQLCTVRACQISY